MFRKSPKPTTSGSIRNNNDIVLSLPANQLEGLAKEMLERLTTSKLIQNHRLGKKQLLDSFTGEDAVTVLRGIMEEENIVVLVTREQALQVGRDIAETFQFFVHGNPKKASTPEALLEDTARDIFVFKNNLPSQALQTQKAYPTYFDKVRLMQSKVKLGVNVETGKTYDESFVAREAVDTLMKIKLVKSRKEAVHMVRKMNEKVNCCHHVSKPETKFSDNDQVYQFVPLDEVKQNLSPKKTKTTKVKGIKKIDEMNSSLPEKNTADLSADSTKNSDGSSTNKKSKTVKSVSVRTASSQRKDKSYYQDRALDVRSRLNKHRDGCKILST